jgi:hypothetical protein
VKKTALSLIVFFLVSVSLQASFLKDPDEKLFQDAKILIFDKEWRKAQVKLEEIIDDYPDSRWYSEAVFYLGKSLEEQKGKEKEALRIYKKYIQLDDRNQSLTEESEIAIVDLSFKLYEQTQKGSYLREIDRRLSSENKVIRYWAAFKISRAANRKVALKARPVLFTILEKERDTDLRDRAKIYLLRIDPDALQDYEEEKYERKARILKFRVYKKGKNEPAFSLNIPWTLADLALSSIPDDLKKELKEEGYDLDKIAKELTRVRGNIVEIKGEKSVFKFWID